MYVKYKKTRRVDSKHPPIDTRLVTWDDTPMTCFANASQPVLLMCGFETSANWHAPCDVGRYTYDMFCKCMSACVTYRERPLVSGGTAPWARKREGCRAACPRQCMRACSCKLSMPRWSYMIVFHRISFVCRGLICGDSSKLVKRATVWPFLVWLFWWRALTLLFQGMSETRCRCI